MNHPSSSRPRHRPSSLAATLAVALAFAFVPRQARPEEGAAAPGQAAEGPLPGLAGLGLTPEQAAVVEAYARRAYCYCGCPHTLATCLRVHAGCHHGPRMLAMAARLARAGASDGELGAALDAYYGGFDRSRRAALDPKEFGPPLGEPSAPVAIVEYSDFTCPYCGRLRASLEAFVAEHPGRVKLFYKPFPIPSHARSREAALAGEWARDHGLFWKMHDLLFENPHALSDDDLASYAERAGGDADDLRQALAEDRNAKRIRASQTEARKAGLTGTPTLFVNGRRLGLALPAEAMPELLGATLEDEEEWQAHGHWEKD